MSPAPTLPFPENGGRGFVGVKSPFLNDRLFESWICTCLRLHANRTDVLVKPKAGVTRVAASHRLRKQYTPLLTAKKISQGWRANVCDTKEQSIINNRINVKEIKIATNTFIKAFSRHQPEFPPPTHALILLLLFQSLSLRCSFATLLKYRSLCIPMRDALPSVLCR